MPRSIPISVRVSTDDAAFLAAYEAPGANTPSEKIRAILSSARHRYEGSKDYTECAELMRDMVRPSERALKQTQRYEDLRSDFIFKLYERLPEMMAELIAGAPKAKASKDELLRFEGNLAKQIFSLLEEILDLGITAKSRSYDPNLMNKQLGPVLEVFKLINITRNHQNGA